MLTSEFARIFKAKIHVSVPVVEGSSSQDDGIVIGPFWGVAPCMFQGIPEVAPGRVAHNPIREAPPHQEGKVHLWVQKCNTQALKQPPVDYWSWCCTTPTSLVSRIVSSSRLSTASVSMATWGRNRLVVWERGADLCERETIMLSNWHQWITKKTVKGRRRRTAQRISKSEMPHGSLDVSDIQGRQAGKNKLNHRGEIERQEQEQVVRLSVRLLTFFLPSVTVRGTGMGGHLLRLGGGFSLFQRMMI